MGFLKKVMRGNNIYCIPGRFHDYFEKKSLNKRNNVLIPIYKKKNKNYSFSIISNDCVGGVISHELGQQFRSPFVNLYISPSDFYKLISDFNNYMNYELVNITSTKDYCPMGKLGDIILWFIHSSSFDTAKEEWERRKERINRDNLYITVFDYTDKGVEENTNHYMPVELLEKFLSLDYKKIIIMTTDKRKKNYPNVVYLKKYRRVQSTLVPIDIEMFGGHRIFDRYFDYVEWLNS